MVAVSHTTSTRPTYCLSWLGLLHAVQDCLNRWKVLLTVATCFALYGAVTEPTMHLVSVVGVFLQRHSAIKPGRSTAVGNPEH